MNEGQFVLVNLCPHNIVVYDKAGDTVLATFTHTGEPLRLIEDKVPACPYFIHVNGARVPVGVPPRYTGLSHSIAPGVSIIVPQLVAQYIVDHEADFAHVRAVYCPNTGPANVVRDKQGVIVGTKQLVLYHFTK